MHTQRADTDPSRMIPIAHAPRWRTLSPGTPESPEWSHSGIAVDGDGAVYWADPAGGGLLVQSPESDVVRRISVPLLEIHGVTHQWRDGRARLWLADPGFKMRPPHYELVGQDGVAGSLDLHTNEFTPLEQPAIAAYADRPWRPTAIAVGGEHTVVADGYGESLVHFFLGADHDRTLDGSDSGTRFACPHGAAFASIRGERHLVVADRGNRRLVLFDLDGAFVCSVTHPLVQSPSGLAVWRDLLLVTDLDGALIAVDLAGGRITEIVPFSKRPKQDGWPNSLVAGEVRRPPLHDGILNSPHGIAVGPNGAIYLTEWVVGGREVELTSWLDSTE